MAGFLVHQDAWVGRPGSTVEAERQDAEKSVGKIRLCKAEVNTWGVCAACVGICERRRRAVWTVPTQRCPAVAGGRGEEKKGKEDKDSKDGAVRIPLCLRAPSACVNM